MSVYDSCKSCKCGRVRKYLTYLWSHKYHVYIQGRKLGVSRWQLLVHDWTKFTPIEFVAYLNWFYPTGERSQEDRDAFDRAWNHHQKSNRHHWQWWLLRNDCGGVRPLPIPDKYVREMVADWAGAGAALGKPDTWAWYRANYDNIVLEPGTRERVEAYLGKLQAEVPTACGCVA